MRSSRPSSRNGRWERSASGFSTTARRARRTELGAIGDIGFALDGLGLEGDIVVVAGDNLFGSDISDFGRAARELQAPLLAVREVEPG